MYDHCIIANSFASFYSVSYSGEDPGGGKPGWEIFRKYVKTIYRYLDTFSKIYISSDL